MADQGINQEALNCALKSIRALRSNVLEVFRSLSDGAAIPEDEKEREKFINEIKQTLTNVQVRMRDLETASTLLGSPTTPLNLGNSGLLSQDAAYDKTPLYNEVVKTHRWFDQMLEHSAHAHAILAQNSLKRSTFNSVTKQNRIPSTGHNVAPQNVDAVTAQLCHLFPDMQIKVVRPCGAPAVLLITLGRTLKALIILRGLTIEWVVVKGYNEEFYNEDGKLDMWSGSRFDVFKKVTDHANAAMLHFVSPYITDLCVRSFLTWLRSYNTLFTASCCKCGNRLLDNMPPTWRDVRNLDPYHEACKP
ncbi:mediator of RNA polymerase II transcription subunit 27-B-like [Uloborus diversus]|uniref:mediator of RNA polymerase II transcription subunit 27-B-like n=1 Tax=Uloborus diversus TaxID=327109 RepID=UPI00240A9885|nr:mediator of RNA polymerase II transcription subunit 27-B-like [Uloborus diversus]